MSKVFTYDPYDNYYPYVMTKLGYVLLGASRAKRLRAPVYASGIRCKKCDNVIVMFRNLDLRFCSLECLSLSCSDGIPEVFLEAIAEGVSRSRVDSLVERYSASVVSDPWL